MDTNQIIKDLGGTYALAELCEVTPGAVSQWRHDGIPRARLMFLRAVRPDVFNQAKPSKASRKKAAKVGAGGSVKAA